MHVLLQLDSEVLCMLSQRRFLMTEFARFKDYHHHVSHWMCIRFQNQVFELAFSNDAEGPMP